MARFRVETVQDPQTGLFRAELYFPEDASVPKAVTKPIYVSHEHAAEEVIEMFRSGFPDQPITASRS